MKKILLMGSLLALSLFAKEEVVTPEIEMNLSLNDDAKILVDCSYKEVKVWFYWWSICFKIIFR